MAAQQSRKICTNDRRPVYAVGLCRSCYDKCRRRKTREYARKRYRIKKDEILAYNRDSYHKAKKDPNWNRKRNKQWVLNRYRISVEEYDRMVELQRGLCLICEEKPKKDLYVDHDHQTGKIRGLLCPRCNSGLGMFRDHPELLGRAIEYLWKEEIQ